MHIVVTISFATIATVVVIGWIIITAFLSQHRKKQEQLRRIKEIERAERREKFAGKIRSITRFRSRATARPPRLPKM